MFICISSKLFRWFYTLFVVCLFISACDSPEPESIAAGRAVSIAPDYSGCVIPPNIAPLNFIVQQTGESYYIDIYCADDNEHIIINQTSGKVQIPLKDWRSLLQRNRGKTLSIDISIEDSSGQWLKYDTIKNDIASEEIDSHVTYRLINPAYVLWYDMGIYQRCVENFEETTVFSNKYTKRNCMNCHSFCNNDPDKMMFHMRSSYGGTVIIRDGVIRKINTATDFTMSAAVYPAWHPDGNHIAFSVNKIQQQFHSAKDKSVYVSDNASDLVLYDIEKNMITTSPKVSTTSLENIPHWSPDGKYLYFSSCPDDTGSGDYKETKYDIKRIACDVATRTWGEVETIISADETGKSSTFPKVSPDNKYLLFSMTDYGYFDIFFKSSDLYLMDLDSRTYKYLPLNSDYTDSYHSWSSNSRWFVFASKRLDGLCTRLYFSYLDKEGNVSKPILMPQEDPEFYDHFIKNYNVPEMVKGAIKISPYEIAQAIYKDATPIGFDPDVDTDALSGATWIEKQKKDKK